MASDVIEVRVPGTLECDARAALVSLRVAAATRRKADARIASADLWAAAQWVYGTTAWDRLRRAAQAIDLRLYCGRPWLRVVRAQLAAVGDLLRQMSGEVEGDGR